MLESGLAVGLLMKEQKVFFIENDQTFWSGLAFFFNSMVCESIISRGSGTYERECCVYGVRSWGGWFGGGGGHIHTRCVSQ